MPLLPADNNSAQKGEDPLTYRITILGPYLLSGNVY